MNYVNLLIRMDRIDRIRGLVDWHKAPERTLCADDAALEKWVELRTELHQWITSSEDRHTRAKRRRQIDLAERLLYKRRITSKKHVY